MHGEEDRLTEHFYNNSREGKYGVETFLGQSICGAENSTAAGPQSRTDRYCATLAEDLGCE